MAFPRISVGVHRSKLNICFYLMDLACFPISLGEACSLIGPCMHAIMKGEAPKASAKLIECSPALWLEKTMRPIPKARPAKASIPSKANRNTFAFIHSLFPLYVTILATVLTNCTINFCGNHPSYTKSYDYIKLSRAGVMSMSSINDLVNGAPFTCGRLSRYVSLSSL